MFIRWGSSKLQQPQSIKRTMLEENFSWEQRHELSFSLQPLQTFPKHTDNVHPAVCGPTTQGQATCKLPLASASYPNLLYASRCPGSVTTAGSAGFPEKNRWLGLFLLDWEAMCISRQSNKSSAHFSLSKFPHHFLLSLLSSLASKDDISTLSSRPSPLSALPGSSIFHPPWCLSAQRTASRLSSPKQAAFVSGPLESHRSHLGSVIFFFKDPGLVSDIFFHLSGISHCPHLDPSGEAGKKTWPLTIFHW